MGIKFFTPAIKTEYISCGHICAMLDLALGAVFPINTYTVVNYLASQYRKINMYVGKNRAN